MRHSSLLLIALLAPSSGCSALIAAAGHDPSKLTTMEEVHARFGKPTCTGTTDEKRFEQLGIIASDKNETAGFESYHTRRKISNPYAGGYAMAFGMTLGLSEFVAFPFELYRLGHNTLLGQDVCFTYDTAGKVTDIFVNRGRYLFSVELPLPSPGVRWTDRRSESTTGLEELGKTPASIGSADFKCIQ